MSFFCSKRLLAYGILLLSSLQFVACSSRDKGTDRIPLGYYQPTDDSQPIKSLVVRKPSEGDEKRYFNALVDYQSDLVGHEKVSFQKGTKFWATVDKVTVYQYSVEDAYYVDQRLHLRYSGRVWDGHAWSNVNAEQEFTRIDAATFSIRLSYLDILYGDSTKTHAIWNSSVIERHGSSIRYESFWKSPGGESEQGWSIETSTSEDPSVIPNSGISPEQIIAVKKQMSEAVANLRNSGKLEYDLSKLKENIREQISDSPGTPSSLDALAYQIFAGEKESIIRILDEAVVLSLTKYFAPIAISVIRTSLVENEADAEKAVNYYRDNFPTEFRYIKDLSLVILPQSTMDGIYHDEAAEEAGSSHQMHPVGMFVLANPKSTKLAFGFETAKYPAYRGSYKGIKYSGDVMIPWTDLYGAAISKLFKTPYVILCTEKLISNPSLAATSTIIHEMRHFFDYRMYQNYFASGQAEKDDENLKLRLERQKFKDRTLDELKATEGYLNFMSTCQKVVLKNTSVSIEKAEAACNTVITAYHAEQFTNYLYLSSIVEKRGWGEEMRYFKKLGLDFEDAMERFSESSDLLPDDPSEQAAYGLMAEFAEVAKVLPQEKFMYEYFRELYDQKDLAPIPASSGASSVQSFHQ